MAAITVISPIANKAQLLIDYPNAFDWSGEATTSMDGAPPAQYCLSSGDPGATAEAAMRLDPRIFVSNSAGRQWRQALTQHTPNLFMVVKPLD